MKKFISIVLTLLMLMQIGATSVFANDMQKLTTPTNFTVGYDIELGEDVLSFDESTPSQYVERYVFELFLINDYTLFNTWNSNESYDEPVYSITDLQDDFEWVCEEMGFDPAETKLAMQIIAVSNDQDVCANSDFSPLIDIDGNVIADSEIVYLSAGIAGDTSKWKFSKDGVLTVSGTGEAEVDAIDFDYLIKKIVIEEGITSISIAQQTGFFGVNEIITYGKNLEVSELGDLAIYTNLNNPVLYAPADSLLYARVMDESDENRATITVLDINDAGADFRKLLGEDMADAAKVVSDLDIVPQLYTLRNKNVTKGQLALAMTRFEMATLYTNNKEAGSYTDLEDDTFETGCINRWIEYGNIAPNSETEYGRFDDVTYGLVIDAIRIAAPDAEVSLAGKSATDKVTYGELASLYYQAITPEFLMNGTVSYHEVFKGSAEFFYDEYGNYKARLNGTRQGEFDTEDYENIVDTEYYVYDMDLLNINEDDDITLYITGSDIVTGLLSTYDLEPAGYSADFTINGGATETTNTTVSIALSATGYTKYKIENGSYSSITSSPVSYTLDTTHGNKLINVTFADNDGYTKTVSKSIKLNNMHNITYMVDGEEFKKVSVGCGLAIPALEDEPVKAGFAFDGWDDLPPVMPDNDITVTATFVEEPPLATGTCGDNATFTLTNSGTLIIDGTGVIDDFSGYSEYTEEDIKAVVINKGITEIGDNMFYEMFELETISIPDTVTKIGTGLVKGSKVTKVVIPESVTSIDMDMAFEKCPSDIEVYFMNKDIELVHGPVGQYASGIKMYGYADSAVQEYAENAYCTFIAIDPDFTINDGAFAVGGSPELTLKFNSYAMDYEQYKINDGAYTAITGDTVTFTVDSKDGEKEITVTFKKDDREFAKTHTIIYDNKHSVIYKVNGETYKSVKVGCGHEIPAFEEVPTVEGYLFIKWDDAPEVMPDDEVVINAVLTKVDSEVVDSLLTEEEKAEGVAVNVSMTVKTENTAIADAITANYSKYTASIMLDITLSKGKEGQEATEITETEELIPFEIDIPAEIQGKDEYIILRDHEGVVDAITTAKNENGEYIVVAEKKITLYAKKFSDYMLLAKDAEKLTVVSGGGFSGYAVKFETNGADKIKTQYVNRNNVAKAPENPVKEGFVFGGWYTDKELTTAFDFETKITKSITLYAKWTEASKTSIVLTIGEKDAVINGETKSNDVAPIIVNERTMLPIRFIAEELGAKVGWDDKTRTVTVSLDDVTITVVIGESVALVGEEVITLDSAAFIENDRTYLPIRFVMENLGADVQWNEETRQVTITK